MQNWYQQKFQNLKIPRLFLLNIFPFRSLLPCVWSQSCYQSAKAHQWRSILSPNRGHQVPGCHKLWHPRTQHLLSYCCWNLHGLVSTVTLNSHSEIGWQVVNSSKNCRQHVIRTTGTQESIYSRNFPGRRLHIASSALQHARISAGNNWTEGVWFKF